MPRIPNLATVYVLALVGVPAMAESLPDPTRPMDVVTSSRVGAAPIESYGPVLQSTLVSPHRRSAVISGQPVKIGDTFAGSVVVDISSYEVRMSRAGRETSLRLSPKLAKEKGKVE